MDRRAVDSRVEIRPTLLHPGGSPMPQTSTSPKIIPTLAQETLYIGIDVGKFRHVAGFVSHTLLKRHERFENCPVLTFDQSLEGFRVLLERIETYVPVEQVVVLMEKTG